MLKKLKIGVKLMLGFFIAVLILSSAGIVAIVLLNQSDSDYSNILENYGFAQGELGNLGRHFQASRVASLYVVSAPDEASRKQYMADLALEDAGIQEHLLEIKNRLPNAPADQQTAFTQLETFMQTFHTERDKVLQECETLTGTDARIALYQQKMTPFSMSVRTALDAMVEDKTTVGIVKSDALSAQTGSFTWIMVAIMIGSAGISMFLAMIIARSISKPVQEVEQAAIHMADGDYDVVITYQGADEIGRLVQSMMQMMTSTKSIILDAGRCLADMADGNFDTAPSVKFIGVYQDLEKSLKTITDSLNETLGQINQASDQVSSGSDQVSSGAQALSQGATEQASSVEELAATINEISVQVKANATNARDASMKANKAGEEVIDSNQKMQDLIAAMAEISNSSQEIGKVIKVIEDIAFQTNILALNAAVEAARAGAAGKGFAVVADEVRNLASKSAEAAKGTTMLIEGAVKAVENGTKLVDDTAQSLLSVVDGTKEVTDIVDKISLACGEQAVAITQITMGIDQISSVVQTNSATAQESAAASEELSGQAALLKTLVERFNLKSSGSSFLSKPVTTDYHNAHTAGGFASSDKY